MPSYAIISDVHANLEALNAVLQNIDEEKVDSLLFLGDSVGYGPDPNECIELLKAKSTIVLAGNHDWGAIGLTDTTYFNPFAKVAIEWTSETLSDENKAFLDTLPLTESIKADSIYLVHSSPKEPEKWHYLSYEYEASMYFPCFDDKICFIGHSHIPFIVESSPTGKIQSHYNYGEIKKRSRYIINVGSVGQPRDGIPHAAYALLRDNTVEIKRVSYDIVVTQKKMRKAGLPDYLIERLAFGR